MPSEELPGASLPSGDGGAPHAHAASVIDAHGAPYGNYFVATYPPFSQWTSEGVRAYRDVLDRPVSAPPVPPLGLYVHIPFCVDRCRYCYYLSYGKDDRGDLGRYVDALISELRLYGDRAALANRPLDFVYVGGGTPSLLSRTALTRLFEGLQQVRPWDTAREVTFECAPRSVTAAKMQLLRQAGITRLSLGVQQLDDEVLTRNGRVHLIPDVEAAYAAVRAADFPVVNLDLMVGLVGETRGSMRRSLERAIALAPDSVTLYQMEIPLNTPLYRDLKSGAEDAAALADWEEKGERLTLAFDALAAAGYEPISAYAMVKDRSRHDFVYQREQYLGADLLGIGASAFGYIQGIHHQNAPELSRYTDRLEAGQLPLFRAHALDDDERLVREFVLQLKLGGLRRDHFQSKFGVDVLERFREPIGPLVEKGWISCDDREIRVTPRGLPRVDHVIPLFYQPRHRVDRYS